MVSLEYRLIPLFDFITRNYYVRKI